MPVIIGTGGHVDHGKTLLVATLTGDNRHLDRLDQEKARGLTIDFGLAYLEDDKGNKISFVDVPGHEDFVNNMVVGASGIDIGLLVVAADDSVMPQTVEHLEIMDFLGIQHFVAVISKTDILDEETVEIVEEDIKNLFSQHPDITLHSIYRTSAKEGVGIKELKKELIELCKIVDQDPKHTEEFFRLPVDRVFTIQGFGTVITGSLASGRVSVGDTVEITPQNVKARVRGIEIDDQSVETAVRGQRTALNLSGIDREKLKRGNQVVHPGLIKPVYMVNVILNPAVSLKNPVENRSEVRFMSGTGSTVSILEILSDEAIVSGKTDYVAQIRFRNPAPVKNGDRFILRNLSPEITVAGGIILEPTTQRLTKTKVNQVERLLSLSKSSLPQRLENFFRKNPHELKTAMDAALEENCSLDRVSEIIKNDISSSLVPYKEMFLHKQTVALYSSHIIEFLKAYHEENPFDLGATGAALRSGLPQYFNPVIIDTVLSILKMKSKIKEDHQKYSLPKFSISLSASELVLSEKILSFMKRPYIKYAPPGRQDIEKQFNAGKSFNDCWRFLTETGKLIKIAQNLFFTAETLEEIKDIIRDQVNRNGHVNVKNLRNILDNSRKYSVALMEYFDKIKFTQRNGDARSLNDDI